MYSANNNQETVDLSKLEKMGMNIFSRTFSRNDENEKMPVHLRVNYDKRTIRIGIDKSTFETFLNQERYSFAVDSFRRRMYFIPHANGYKFSSCSKNARYSASISGKLFDELRYVKGTITGINKQPSRKLLYDENVGLHYISLACDEDVQKNVQLDEEDEYDFPFYD